MKDERNGWIKTVQVTPGVMKEGRSVVAEIEGAFVVSKIDAIYKDQVVVKAFDGKVYMTDAALISELVIEFMDSDLKMIPLKFGQWAAAITGNEINTGKLITFTQKEISGKIIGKVLHNRKKISIEDIDNITYSAYKQGAEDQKIGNASLGMWRLWKDDLSE